MRPRIQSYDATFTTQTTDAITVHNGGVAVTIPSQPGVSTFDDSQSYWVAGDPGDARGQRPLPGRVEQRQGAEHGHVDAGHQRDARWLHAGAGDAAGEVAGRSTEFGTGGGNPARPRSPEISQSIGGGTHGGPGTATAARLPIPPTARTANALPHGWLGRRNVAPNRPLVVARTTTRVGPIE